MRIWALRVVDDVLEVAALRDRRQKARSLLGPAHLHEHLGGVDVGPPQHLALTEDLVIGDAPRAAASSASGSSRGLEPDVPS